MNLRRKQELCLDAIEHSVTMAAKSYARIVRHMRLPDAEQTAEAEVMVLDAWSFVDVAKRLWSVLHNTPGLEHGNAYNAFVKAGAPLVEFRHYVQHLEDETHEVASTGGPIWGSFSWGKFNAAEKTAEIRTYVPGRLAKVKGIPVMNPAGREIHDDVDHFEMSVDGQTINISDFARRIAAFGKRLQAASKNAATRGEGDNAILILNLDSADVGA